MKPTTLGRSYYPALDGLRGLAILAVLFHHNFDFLPIPRFGWLGVDLFFVLSGFLITDILLRTKEQKNFLTNFFIRRVLRIFPLYYGIIILFFILAPLAKEFKDQYSYCYIHQGMLWIPLQNLLQIISPRPNSNTVFDHFWTLSVEEQFYLFWPFIILLCRKKKQLIWIVSSVLFGFIIFRLFSFLYFGSGMMFYQLQFRTRIDGLCIGSLIAIWKNISVETVRKKLVVLSTIILSLHAIAFILSKTELNLPHFSIVGYSTMGVFFGWILILSIENRNKHSKILFENKAIKGLGKISYGLYVYHWPLLVIFKFYFIGSIVHSGLTDYQSYIIVSISAAIVAVVVSILSYNLFEKRILALKEKITVEKISRRLGEKLFPLYTHSPAK
jgi:peptidoglycan/LPS O-acetylase OafA/YrhL